MIYMTRSMRNLHIVHNMPNKQAHPYDYHKPDNGALYSKHNKNPTGSLHNLRRIGRRIDFAHLHMLPHRSIHHFYYKSMYIQSHSKDIHDQMP